MEKIQIPCSSEVLSKTIINKYLQQSDKTSPPIFSAITETSKIWRQGQRGNITITFGTYGCNGCSPDAAWSYIGSTSNSTYPSMNLGFIDPPFGTFVYRGTTYNPPSSASRNYCGNSLSSCTQGWVPGATVIHEFGHALGMMHEHQNNLQNANPIHLNNSAVIAYYERLGMTASDAITNVINNYECSSTVCNYSGTTYDINSIMLYYLPDSWIASGYTNPTKPNFILSNVDKQWLTTIYPEQGNNPELTISFIDNSPEPWKVAWVCKIVEEVYGPILGINWIFKHSLIINEDNTNSNTTVTTVTTTTTTTTEDTTGTGQPIIEDRKLSILEIVIIVVAILIILSIIISTIIYFDLLK